MVMMAEEETEITDACIIFAEWGFGLGRKEVEGIVSNYLKCTKKKNPFKIQFQERVEWFYETSP